MTLFNQFAISIALIIIAVILLVGVILLSANIFKINKTLERQNDLIKISQRPYLNFTYSKNHLLIKNTGKSSATIDSIIFNNEESNALVDTKINPKQVYSVQVKDIDTIIVKYHNKDSNYQDVVTL